MFSANTLSALLKNDKVAQKQVFEALYSKLVGISVRYSKNQIQANEIVIEGFNNCLLKLQQQKSDSTLNLEAFFENQFIKECVKCVKAVKSEYYLLSTVYATPTETKSYDLGEPTALIDVNTANNEVLIKSLQQLMPIQRLIFNLHVIDGYPLIEVADLLEASLETVKSNLEKARYSLQKNIEKNIKTFQHEQ